MVECITNKKVLTKGNYAIANAAVIAGCECYFGYPILRKVKSVNL